MPPPTGAAGNRALGAVLREKPAPHPRYSLDDWSRPDEADAATAEPVATGVLSEDEGEVDVTGLPEIGDTMAFVEGDSGQSQVTVAPSQGEAESWLSGIVDPTAAGFVALSLPPNFVINTMFYTNSFNRIVDEEIDAAQRRNADTSTLREKRRAVPKMARARSLRMAPEESIRTYLTMMLVNPDQRWFPENQTMDTMAKLAASTGMVVFLGGIHNVVYQKLGLGRGAGLQDTRAGPDLIGLRITVAPTIMWWGNLLDQVGLDGEIGDALAVGAGLSTSITAHELAMAGRAARLGPKPMTPSAAAASPVRRWLRTSAAMLGNTTDAIWNLRSDVVNGFRIQKKQTLDLITNIRKLGLGAALKAGPIPGIWKVGPLTLILPAAQAYVGGQLGEPPPPNSELDDTASATARALWHNFIDPSITAVVVAGPRVAGPVSAVLGYLRGMEETQLSRQATVLAISHGDRVNERVDRIERAVLHGGLDSDPVAVRYAEQLRTGLRENGDFDPADDPVERFIRANQAFSDIDPEVARADLLDRLVAALATDYHRRHQSKLGISDLRHYQTYLRMAVGRPADGQAEPIHVEAE